MEASDARARNKIAWTRLDTLAIGLICAAAAALRGVGLGSPSEEIFDENFYARDACWYIRGDADVCHVMEEANLEHPPLGKWFIALGEAAFGTGPIGWRAASLVAGVLMIAVTYVLARKLLSSTFAASFAASLLAIDFLHFVHSRVAMLDIFLGLFIVAAFACLAFDRDDLLSGRARLRDRPWRIAAGIAAGAAISVKWTGVVALAGLVVTTIAWEFWARRPATRRRAIVDVIRAAGLPMLVTFVALPAFVYLVTHIGRVEGAILTLPWADGSWFESFIDRQQGAYRFHRDLVQTHPYASPPWWWLLLKRGIPYHFDRTGDVYRQVTGAGSPVVWWLSIVALLVTTITWLRRNSPERPEGLVLAGFYWNFLPWVAFAWAGFLLGSTRSSLFIFYVLPLLPFMFISIASIAQRLISRTTGKVVVASFSIAAVAVFAFYYPLLTGRPLTQDQWRARIWIFNSCGRDGAPLTLEKVTTVNGTLRTTTKEMGREFSPPTGFCWIQMRQEPLRIDLDRHLSGSR